MVAALPWLPLKYTLLILELLTRIAIPIEKFFDFKQSKEMGNIDKLSGTTLFKEQIISGKSEKEIRASWEPGLSQFKEMRKKYAPFYWAAFVLVE